MLLYFDNLRRHVDSIVCNKSRINVQNDLESYFKSLYNVILYFDNLGKHVDSIVCYMFRINVQTVEVHTRFLHYNKCLYKYGNWYVRWKIYFAHRELLWFYLYTLLLVFGLSPFFRILFLCVHCSIHIAVISPRTVSCVQGLVDA